MYLKRYVAFTFVFLSLRTSHIHCTTKFLNNIVTAASGAMKFLQDSKERLLIELPNQTPKQSEIYDFIIIGAGSAGSVLASRLSENSSAKILLIEEGGVEKLRMDIPALALHQFLNHEIYWDYETEPSNHYCLGRVGNSCRLPVGKVMGGSSVMNIMIATRGTLKY